MADNTTINAGSGGDVIATDDLTTLNGGVVSGFKVQRMKIGFGSDASLRDVDSSNPLPVVDTSTATIATNTTGLNNTVGTSGSALPTKGIVVQGSDGSNARAMRTNSAGAQWVTPGDSTGLAVPANALYIGLNGGVTGNLTGIKGDANGAVYTSKNDQFGTTTAMTITLASLANSTAGVGRQSTLITSNTAQSAFITCKIKMGTTPTANSLVYVYLIRGDGTNNDDVAGASDAGLTVVNAPLLGTLLCSAATTGLVLQGLFDTAPLGSLGKSFGIAIVNSSGVALDSTGGNHSVSYTLKT